MITKVTELCALICLAAGAKTRGKLPVYKIEQNRGGGGSKQKKSNSCYYWTAPNTPTCNFSESIDDGMTAEEQPASREILFRLIFMSSIMSRVSSFLAAIPLPFPSPASRVAIRADSIGSWRIYKQSDIG